MTQSGIALVAGLGNHGSQYALTRHNVGFWFIERLQREYSVNFSLERKFKAETGRIELDGQAVRIAVPNTFMNLSGQSIAPLVAYYRIEPRQILVIHDDLDLAPGTARLKIGGGHGGHNGLRDIISRLGSDSFVRLRLGIGHPGPGSDVSAYVLRKPLPSEQKLIEDAIEGAMRVFPDVVTGNYARAMNQLHTQTPEGKQGGN
jgi:PTH1 family peptidyl-tRNA hydrolase